MRRIMPLSCGFVFVLFLGLVVLPGCSPQGGKDSADKKKHDHAKHGPHGGPYAEWEKGDDEYHVEFTVDPATKQVTLYVLDDKCKNSPTKIDAVKVTKVKLTITSPKPVFSVECTFDAKKSEAKQGFAFVATHDRFGEKVDFKGTIDGTVAGTEFSGDFPNANYQKPDPAKTSKLRELYLKPGGIYTQADIDANGTTTPDVKFAGIIWKHAKDLKPGDKICPITDAKAEATCAWVVNGQRYEFCCSPCVDNFIELAHTDPTKIKPAKEYVKKAD